MSRIVHSQFERTLCRSPVASRESLLKTVLPISEHKQAGTWEGMQVAALYVLTWLSAINCSFHQYRLTQEGGMNGLLKRIKANRLAAILAVKISRKAPWVRKAFSRLETDQLYGLANMGDEMACLYAGDIDRWAHNGHVS